MVRKIAIYGKGGIGKSQPTKHSRSNGIFPDQNVWYMDVIPKADSTGWF